MDTTDISYDASPMAMSRPGLPPGIYFRLLLIGYFEGRTMALGAMLTVLWMLIDEGITAIWSPPRDRTRSDRPLLGFLVAELVA
jgi:hypothetical protein